MFTTISGWWNQFRVPHKRKKKENRWDKAYCSTTLHRVRAGITARDSPPVVCAHAHVRACMLLLLLVPGVKRSSFVSSDQKSFKTSALIHVSQGRRCNLGSLHWMIWWENHCLSVPYPVYLIGKRRKVSGWGYYVLNTCLHLLNCFLLLLFLTKLEQSSHSTLLIWKACGSNFINIVLLILLPLCSFLKQMTLTFHLYLWWKAYFKNNFKRKGSLNI